MRKFEKNTARKSLPSASQLPIIVPMKIWFRTEAERGGEQSARQHSSANPTSPKSPWSLQRPVSSDTSPAKNPADHRPTIYQAGSSHSPLATRHCSHISNRFWPANRSCRKQTIKPCLTGARTAVNVLRELSFPPPSRAPSLGNQPAPKRRKSSHRI